MAVLRERLEVASHCLGERPVGHGATQDDVQMVETIYAPWAGAALFSAVTFVASVVGPFAQNPEERCGV